MNLKTKRGKIVLFGTLASVPVVGAAVGVPLGLLQPWASPGAISQQEMELREFMRKYPNTIDRSANSVAVKAGAFVRRKDLPEDFALPQMVTSVRDDAFKGARLPRGFKIPNATTNLAATAFSEAAISDDDWWDKYPVAPGSRIGPVEQSGEYRDFDANYANTLDKRTIKYAAFKNKRDLPDDFALPSFLTRIRSNAFESAQLPAGFTLPGGVRVIEERAFQNVSVPAGFRLPDGVTEIGIEGMTTFFPFLNATLNKGFVIPATVKRIFSGAFHGATLPEGFSIPASVEIGDDVNGRWESIANNRLEGVKLPDGCK